MKLVPAPLVTMCTAVRNRLALYNTMRAIILDLHVYCTVVRQWRFTVHGFKVTSRQYRRATPLLLTIQRWSMLSFWFPYCHAHTHKNRKANTSFIINYPLKVGVWSKEWAAKTRKLEAKQVSLIAFSRANMLNEPCFSGATSSSAFLGGMIGAFFANNYVEIFYEWS